MILITSSCAEVGYLVNNEDRDIRCLFFMYCEFSRDIIHRDIIRARNSYLIRVFSKL